MKENNPEGFRNLAVKARNEQRRQEKREIAEARNAKYRSQFSSLEDELAYCLKHGGRAKQVEKLKRKIERRDNERKTEQVVEVRGNRVPRKSRKRKSRPSSQKS